MNIVGSRHDKKEIKPQSLKKNFLFQGVYQILIYVMPLLIVPYVTRKLGDTQLGIYSYTYSLAGWFVMFGMLGIDKHGQRIIATRREDSVRLRKTFWSLYYVHAAFAGIVLIAYMIFAWRIGEAQYRGIYLILAVYVASSLFDITWLFYGLENFQSVIIKNLIIRSAEYLTVFCFVRNTGDLPKYTLIRASSALLGQAIMLPQAVRLLKPTGLRLHMEDFREHIKPLFVLFLAVLSTQISGVIDKCLLRFLTVIENVAYYEYSWTTINIFRSFTEVSVTVLFPRACSDTVKDNKGGLQRYYDLSVQCIAFFGMGAVWGLLGCAKLFAILFYGMEFRICGSVIIGMSPLVLIVGLTRIIRMQYMIPRQMNWQYNCSILLESLTNIVLSALLVPRWGIYGVVAGTILSDSIGLIYELCVCREFMKLTAILSIILPYTISGAAMYLIIIMINMRFNATVWHLLLQIAAGGAAYCLLCGAYLIGYSSWKKEIRAALGQFLHRWRRRRL